MTDELWDLLAVRPGESVLDVGCGTGVWTARIAAAGAVVVGIDKSPLMVEQARAAHPGVEFVDIDLLELDERELFDAVFSCGALHWIKPPERAAAKMFQALKPGGRLVAELGAGGAVNDALLAAAAVLGGGPADTPFKPDLAGYANLLRSAGFEVTLATCRDERVRILASRPD